MPTPTKTALSVSVLALPLIYFAGANPMAPASPGATPRPDSSAGCPRLPPSQPHLPPADNPGDPDYLPFDTSMLQERGSAGRWVSRMRGGRWLPGELRLPPVPPAPTGEAAMKLAREQGWPDHWRARMRPRHFLLGPPKTGTTTLYSCYSRAMIGDPPTCIPSCDGEVAAEVRQERAWCSYSLAPAAPPVQYVEPHRGTATGCAEGVACVRPGVLDETGKPRL